MEAYTIRQGCLYPSLTGFAKWIIIVSKERKQGLNGIVVALCWTTWYARNLQFFKNKSENSQLPVATPEAFVESYRGTKMPPL